MRNNNDDDGNDDEEDEQEGDDDERATGDESPLPLLTMSAEINRHQSLDEQPANQQHHHHHHHCHNHRHHRHHHSCQDHSHHHHHHNHHYEELVNPTNEQIIEDETQPVMNTTDDFSYYNYYSAIPQLPENFGDADYHCYCSQHQQVVYYQHQQDTPPSEQSQQSLQQFIPMTLPLEADPVQSYYDSFHQHNHQQPSSSAAANNNPAFSSDQSNPHSLLLLQSINSEDGNRNCTACGGSLSQTTDFIICTG